MKLKLWQIDAFANRPLEGNPAAVVPLDAWLDAGLMQKIATENNLSETAFFVKSAPGALGPLVLLGIFFAMLSPNRCEG